MNIKALEDNYYEVLVTLGDNDLRYLETCLAKQLEGVFICQLSKEFSEFLRDHNVSQEDRKEFIDMLKETVNAGIV